MRALKLFLIIVFAAPTFVFAQAADLRSTQLTLIELLQQQIQLLLQQVQTLQKQVTDLQTELGATSAQATSTSAIVSEPEQTTEVLPEFTRSLSLGISGDDVRRLQQFLTKDRTIYPEGVISGYFGPLTERAVKKWQEKHGIEQVGRIGSKSLAKLNELRTIGAGKSGIIPPGLLTAPGIQQRLATTTGVTTTIPITTSTATTTVQITTSTATTAQIITTTTSVYVYVPPAQTQTTVQTSATTTSATSTATSTVTSTTTTTPPIFIVTSPNGGEQWTAGNTYTITWTATSTPVTTVRISLYQSGNFKDILISDTSNTGSWSWTIPSTITPGTSYTIRVFNLVYPNNWDDSNGYFSITVPITAPSVAPIGYWKFDGNGYNEIYGSPSPNATTTGNAVFNASGGKFNGYLYIPTGSDSAKIPYNSMFDLPDNFTIEFWFRQRSNQSFNQNLIYKGTPTNNYNFNISRWLWNEYNYGPVIAGHTTVNTGYWTQPSNPNQLPHNEWHHVVFTKSPTYHAYYLDGVLIGSKEITATSNTEYGGPAKTPAVDIIIGDTAVDTDFDNVRIYNVALSRSEVLYNYAESVSASTVAPPVLAVTSPNGGEAWMAGNSYVIVWTMTGAQGMPTTVELYKAGNLISTLVYGAPALSLSWIVPSTLTSGSDYKFRVFNPTYPNNFDDSDNYFSIITASSTATSTSMRIQDVEHQLANISVMVARLSEEIQKLLGR